MTIHSRFRTVVVFALALLMTVTVAGRRPAEAQQGLTLKVEGDHFVDGNGQPKFLVFVSYFDALKGNLGTVNSDFANLRASGVDGVRIFVNWQLFSGTSCAGSYSAYSPSTVVFNQNGTLNSGPLSTLTTVLTYARNNGLYVDLTMDKVPGPEAVYDYTVPGSYVYLMTTANYRAAIQALTIHLRNLGMRHVMFDLGNERDMSNRAVWVPDAEVQTIRNIVKAQDPDRIVMASNTDYTYHAGTVAFAASTPLDVVAYHESRPTNWYALTDTVVASLRAQTPPAARPIYLQEPERWCPSTGYTGANFVQAVTEAKSAGAAAWMFHTESGFNVSSNGLWTQLGWHAPEANFIGTFAAAVNGTTWGACHTTLSALSASIASGGGSGSVNVTNGAGCGWSVSNPASGWVTITGGASGSGNGTVSFNVAANGTGVQRVANLVVSSGSTQRTYTITQQPAAAMSEGYSALQDFNADNYADVADYYGPSGGFWVRQNFGNGTFAAPGANMASGTASTASGWKQLVGDFTADGRADYADLHLASGNFWIHRNLGNGTFDTGNWSSGTAASGGGWEVLVADMNADGYDDLIEHDRSTGQVRTRVNSAGSFGTVVASGYSTPVSADWRLIVADFTGDGYADIADYHIPSAQFWIHQNIGSWAISGAVWGASPNVAFSHPVITTIFGDFTGDGWADYADVQRQTGDFWVHENLKNGTFAPTNVNWGTGRFTSGAGFSIFGQPITIPPQ